VIRLVQIGTETGTAELSSLLSQLNAYSVEGTVLPPPTPAEAMAIYSVAVRLVQLQMTLTDACESDDLAVTRDVLIGIRRMLRTALARVEPEPGSPPRLVLIEGGSS
jgi:hypothetical protein